MNELPERTIPIFNRENFIKGWNMDKAVILVMIFLVPILVFVLLTDGPFYIFLCFAIPIFLIISLPVYSMREQLAEGLNAKDKFIRGQSQATAKILRRYTKDISDGPDDKRDSHHVVLEFKPDQATVSTDIVQFQARISKALFGKLIHRKSVRITYAIEDPGIFILDGEHVPDLPMLK